MPFNWFSNNWKLHTSLKLKHLMWRASNGALLVREQLSCRIADELLLSKFLKDVVPPKASLTSSVFSLLLVVFRNVLQFSMYLSTPKARPMKSEIIVFLESNKLPSFKTTRTLEIPKNIWTARDELFFSKKKKLHKILIVVTF